MERKIKVLFITKWFMNRNDPQVGVFIRKHASAAALYCDVALLCVLSDPNQKKSIEFEDAEEYGVKCTVAYFKKFSSSFSLLNKAVNFYRYLIASRAALKRLRKTFGEHDITHAYIMLRPAIVAYWLKLFKGKPYVASEQWSGYATGRFGERNFTEKFLSRWIFKKAAAGTAVSQFLKSKMIENGMNNRRFEITNNIIEPFPKTSSPLLHDDKIKMLCVADLKDDIKHISGVIRAVSDVAVNGQLSTVNGQLLELHIIGHGADEAMLKKLASDLNLFDRVVFFHGVKKNEEVFQYLYDCDFLVMNSRFETFSLICAESIACGKPVIATRCGGPQEFITPYNGILINPDSPEELKNAIIKMMNDYKTYNSEQMKATMLTKFSTERIGQSFFSIYKTIIDRK